MTRAPWVVRQARARPSRAARQTIYDTTLGWRFVNPRMAELTRPRRWARPPRTSPSATGSAARTRTRSRSQSHQRAVAAAGRRDASPTRSSRSRRRPTPQGRSRRWSSATRARARHAAGEARQAAPGLPRGRHGHRRQRLAAQRRRRLPRARLASARPKTLGASRSRASSRPAAPASTPPHGHRPDRRDPQGARRAPA